MRLIDTHSHLYEPEFDADRDEALARAAAAGVERLLLPAIDSESHERLFALCRRAPGRCIPMMGLHPTSVNDNPRWREELALVERLLDAPPEGIGRFCAVGEIGLDFYWSRDFITEQREAFVAQLRMAWRRGLPVAIHTRAAWEEMTLLIEEECARARSEGASLRGVFHAFSEDEACYRRLRACGDWLFGIGGVVTFKRSQVAAAVPAMELGDLVLETDCPYLTPVPHRGERNESAYVRFVCERVAELKGLPADEVARCTTASAERMFSLAATGTAAETAETPPAAEAEKPRRPHRSRTRDDDRHRHRNTLTDHTHRTMKRVRITVIRKACYRDLMERYENPIEHACDLHEGQSFVAEGWTRPAGLCESAWQTLSPFVMALSHGATNLYDGWMKNPASAMLSCNDGFRPVSFLVEALDEEPADTPANAGDTEDTATADNRPHPDGCSPTIPAPGRPAFPTAAPLRPATAGPEPAAESAAPIATGPEPAADPAAADPAAGSRARTPKNTDTEKTEP